MTYKLVLPPNFTLAQDVFHVFTFKEYKPDKCHFINFDKIELQVNMSHSEKPLKILDRKERVLCLKTILRVKVLWSNTRVKEIT